MSWMTELAAIYDIAESTTEDHPLPLYHIENNAQITVTIDENGNFCSAECIDPKDKKNRPTCMPCTEECASRSSGIQPYPLCEKFDYAAGDYIAYADWSNEKKDKIQKKQDDTRKKHEQYRDLLAGWAHSLYGDPKLDSILSYIEKDCLIHDLIAHKVFHLDENGRLTENMSDFIRWRVESSNPAAVKDVWRDPVLQKKWIDYYTELGKGQSSFCYATGSNQRIAAFHPAKIRNSGDKAKIISSNDTINFTFRGRFETADQACQIGSELSQKAHNALRWLVAQQGIRVGNGLTFVTWNQACSPQPKVIASGYDVMFRSMNDIPEVAYTTGEEFATAIKNCIHGYYTGIPGTANVLIMGLNAATPGRLSIVLYRKMEQTDFVTSLETWHSKMAWFMDVYKKNADNPKKGHWIHTITSPSPKTIAETAYGFMVKNELVEKTTQRLIPCILDGRPVPLDIERQCYASASNLLVLEDYQRSTVLGTACAVIKYNSKEAYKVALETDRKTRDYLYGRLLATAYALEKAALKEKNDKREPNAVRYMQRFSQRPASTWKMLYEKLQPYKRYMKSEWANRYENTVRDITDLFKPEDYISDAPLSGEYLLGYQCQIKDFYRKREEEKNTDDTAITQEEK